MTLDNLKAELFDNIITANSNNVIYDMAKQVHTKVKASIALKNLRKTTIAIRVKHFTQFLDKI